MERDKTPATYSRISEEEESEIERDGNRDDRGNRVGKFDVRT